MNEQFTLTETPETAWKDTSESVEVVIPNDTKLESNEDATAFVMSEEGSSATDALQELSEEDRIRINAETYDAMVTGEEIAEFTADTNISSSEILNEIEKTYGVKLDVSDVLNLIEIKDRLTSKSPGQIVNAYAEMPRGIQGIIKSTYAEIYPDIDEKSPESIPVLNYLAREFILNLYSSTEMGQFIAEYTEAMSDIQNRTGSENIMTDARYDACYDKIKDAYENECPKLQAEYDELKDSNPEEAEKIKGKIERISRAYTDFEDAISYSRIIQKITERPSLLNRAYKDAKYYTKTCMDFDSKFCCEDSNVKIRTLEAVFRSLTMNSFIPEDAAKTICNLIWMEVYDKDIHNVSDKWYVYYLVDIACMLHRTSGFGTVSEKTTAAFREIVRRINVLKDEKEIRKGKKKRR